MQDADAARENPESGNQEPVGENLLRLTLAKLQGRKTYSTLILTALLLGGQYLHWWVLPDEVFKGLQLLALGFIRAGVKAATQNKQEN